MAEIDKPVLDADTTIGFPNVGETICILDVWVTEEGVKLYINDNFTEKRVVEPSYLYTRMELHEYEVRKSFGFEEKDYR